jgi:hypothetical protein
MDEKSGRGGVAPGRKPKWPEIRVRLVAAMCTQGAAVIPAFVFGDRAAQR